MTLKKKFINAITLHFSYEIKIDESVKIADEFAIGFAEWVTKNRNNYDYMIRTDIDGAYMSRTTKELLEIYKKEKGL